MVEGPCLQVRSKLLPPLLDSTVLVSLMWFSLALFCSSAFFFSLFVSFCFLLFRFFYLLFLLFLISFIPIFGLYFELIAFCFLFAQFVCFYVDLFGVLFRSDLSTDR